MPPDPWAFGWTELLAIIGHIVTILGFVIAACVALRGIRKFDDWKMEQLEERRIEIALQALAMTYESKYLFDNIRSPMSFEYEWEDMPRRPTDSEGEWRRRGSFYAIRKRVISQKDFFERAYKLQPQCMALFGRKVEDVFMLMHKARRHVEVASEMPMNRPPPIPQENNDAALWKQLERDIWDVGEFEPEMDRVGKKLADFRTQMEALCRPVIDREIRRKPERARWFGKSASPAVPL